MKTDRRPWWKIHIEDTQKLKDKIGSKLDELAKDIEVIDPEEL